MHIYLIALYFHNATTLIALFTGFGGAIEHCRTNEPFLLWFETLDIDNLMARRSDSAGSRLQRSGKHSQKVKMCFVSTPVANARCVSFLGETVLAAVIRSKNSKLNK